MGRIHNSRIEFAEKRKKLIIVCIAVTTAISMLLLGAVCVAGEINGSTTTAFKITNNDDRIIDEEFGRGEANDDTAESDKSMRTSSHSASVIIEQSSKKIVNGDNYDTRLPMASTTKVVTAILACKSGKLNETVTVPAAACGIEGSSIYLTPNEKIKLLDLVYGLMLRSGNDAATAIALYLGGSIENFADMMNAHAKSVGALNSNFVNPHGLHNPEHYTTAYDLAIITADALDNPDFAAIVATKMHTVEYEGKETRYLANKNKMLTMYDGAIGVKTGYTKAAGRCLVSAAERNGLKFVSVVLNEPDMWAKSVANLDEGFRRTKRVELVEANKELIKIKLNKSDFTVGLAVKNNITEICIDKIEDVCYNFDIDKTLKKSIAIGDRIGELTLTRNGEVLTKADLYAMSVEINNGKH